MNTVNKEDLVREIEQIEIIHAVFKDNLLELKRKQDEILDDFLEALKNKKIDEVRKSIPTV